MAQIICVYVGQASETNLLHGIRNGVWGFKEDVAHELLKNFTYDNDSYVLLASGFTGGSPRVQPEEWIKHDLAKIYLAKISSGIVKSDTLEWPDELAKNSVMYPERFRFDQVNMSIFENVSLNRISAEIAEKLRNSAIAQSRGYLIQNISLEKLKYDLSGTLEAIWEAIRSEFIQIELEEENFFFDKAVKKMTEFDSIHESKKGFYEILLNKFIASNKTYTEFLLELNRDSEEYAILYKLGQLVSYCDQKAANKNEFNEYPDKRTLAKSGVYQTDWVNNLLKYKINGNDQSVLPGSIKNAIAYLKSPSSELTMLSEPHRMMVAKYLLEKESYDKNTFVKNVLDFFSPYNIHPKNPINLTRIISNILYRFPKVKKLWYEKLEGLVVCDNTGWIEDAITTMANFKYIALWWDKSPSGGAHVIKLLKEALKESDDKCFYIYYSNKQVAEYRARIVDFSFENEYAKKNWNSNDVAWHSNTFSGYREENGKGGERFARIVFLADKIEKLEEPIKMEYFEFYNEHSAPTQNNMQPFVEINKEANLVNNLIELNTMTPKEIISHSHQFMASHGFQYQYEEIANFYLSLKAKPFLILAGISGTGKTQLPRKFALSIGMSKEQVIQVPVRPDWTDGSDLLGFTGLDDNFKPKDLTSAIIKAYNNSQKPYFFILDEMNLARVEHYFSDFLSIIETREIKDGEIKTDPILRDEVLQNAKNRSEYKALGWPQNLYLIGTVNMDETTHSFSRKVLDRANSIEMNEVDLSWLKTPAVNIKPLEGISNSFFRTSFLGSLDLSNENKESIKDEITLLIRVNEILEKADLHFAYRVRDEVAFYLILNKEYELLDPTLAFDFQLVQKVLPRIHGSSERVQMVLVELLNLLEGKEFKSNGFEYSQTEGKIDLEQLKYKRASKKILFMLKRFDDDRFTSFWL